MDTGSWTNRFNKIRPKHGTACALQKEKENSKGQVSLKLIKLGIHN